MSSPEDEMEAFIEENCLDDEARGILHDLEPHLQRELLDRGPLTDARNPSAVVLSRVRQLKAAEKKNGPGARGGSASASYIQREIARFVRENELDERAEQCLRESEERVLKELFSRGQLTDARNPSAVVLSRLREIKKDLDQETSYVRGDTWSKGGGYSGGASRSYGGPSGSGGNMTREIARFVRENELDERAEQCLRESEAYILRELFSRGPLTDARNPSAVVLSRLREIKKELGDRGDRAERSDKWYDEREDYDKPRSSGGKGGKAEFMDFMYKMWDEWSAKGSGKGKRSGPY